MSRFISTVRCRQEVSWHLSRTMTIYHERLPAIVATRALLTFRAGSEATTHFIVNDFAVHLRLFSSIVIVITLYCTAQVGLQCRVVKISIRRYARSNFALFHLYVCSSILKRFISQSIVPTICRRFRVQKTKNKTNGKHIIDLLRF